MKYLLNQNYHYHKNSSNVRTLKYEKMKGKDVVSEDYGLHVGLTAFHVSILVSFDKLTDRFGPLCDENGLDDSKIG